MVQKLIDRTTGPFPYAEPWNVVADGYADKIWAMSEHFAREALRLAMLPLSPRVVDIASGPGPLALLAAKQGAIVSAIDFSPEMVDSLRRRADELGIKIADARVGDGQALPYDDESFDGAFSMAGLIFFPDRAAGFRELHRVLHPGRRAVVSSMAALSVPFMTAIDILSVVLPDLPIALGELPLSDPNALRYEMSAAGFREVTIHTINYSETVPSLIEFWLKMQRGAASVALLKRERGEESWTEISESVLNRLQYVLGDGPVDETYAAHLGVGIK